MGEFHSAKPDEKRRISFAACKYRLRRYSGNTIRRGASWMGGPGGRAPDIVKSSFKGGPSLPVILQVTRVRSSRIGNDSKVWRNEVDGESFDVQGS
jgi:hypothetical protein